MIQNPSKKLISILINNYNYAPYLSAAIDSALAQTYERCEVIVVDDGSTDNSRDIILAYGGKVIPVFKENGGQATAFNTGFEKSQGDIICFLDADDIFLPHKAQQLAEIFGCHDDIGWCFHALDRIDNDFKKTPALKNAQAKSGVCDPRQLMQKGKVDQVVPFDGLATSGMCFSRSLLSKILPMPSEIAITSDDYIKYTALGISKGYMLVDSLALQRIHANNAYTLRDDKQLLKADIMIKTAYFMRQNFPELGGHSDKLFAFGLALFTRHREEGQPLHSFVQGYFKLLSRTELIHVQARKAYYLYLRNYIKR